MNAKDKALNLVQEFYHVEVDDITQYGMEWQMAKQCALMCIDEIIEYIDKEGNGDFKYYEYVRQEIDKL